MLLLLVKQPSPLPKGYKICYWLCWLIFQSDDGILSIMSAYISVICLLGPQLLYWILCWNSHCCLVCRAPSRKESVPTNKTITICYNKWSDIHWHKWHWQMAERYSRGCCWWMITTVSTGVVEEVSGARAWQFGQGHDGSLWAKLIFEEQIYLTGQHSQVHLCQMCSVVVRWLKGNNTFGYLNGK